MATDNIYNLLLGIKDDIGQLKSCNIQFKEDMKWQNDKLHTIETQTIKTNGRVGKLEDFTTIQTQINSRIEGLYKEAQSNLKLQIDNMEDKSKRQIDEFKKGGTEIDKISTEYSGKMKLAVITGVISLLTVVATAYVSYNVGNGKTLLNWQNNITKTNE